MAQSGFRGLRLVGNYQPIAIQYTSFEALFIFPAIDILNLSVAFELNPAFQKPALSIIVANPGDTTLKVIG